MPVDPPLDVEGPAKGGATSGGEAIGHPARDARVVLACPACRRVVAEAGSLLRCAGCGQSYPRIPLPRMLTDEYAELLGEERAPARTDSARWGIEDVAYWEACYADRDEQVHVRERIARSRHDAGLRTLLREEHIFRHIRPHLKGETLLDIGCGNAQTVQVLCHPEEVGYTYVGVDLSLSALLTNRQMFPGVFVQASATALPFRAETFAVILMLGTLHHLHDPSGTLRHVLELLKPNGLIALHEVTYRRSHHADESTHNEQVPLETIVATLRESCDIIDLKQEHGVVMRLLGARLADRMRTRPLLTRLMLGLDAFVGGLRHVHPALGPRAALIVARKN